MTCKIKKITAQHCTGFFIFLKKTLNVRAKLHEICTGFCTEKKVIITTIYIYIYVCIVQLFMSILTLPNFIVFR